MAPQLHPVDRTALTICRMAALSIVEVPGVDVGGLVLVVVFGRTTSSFVQPINAANNSITTTTFFMGYDLKFPKCTRSPEISD